MRTLRIQDTYLIVTGGRGLGREVGNPRGRTNNAIVLWAAIAIMILTQGHCSAWAAEVTAGRSVDSELFNGESFRQL
eukprot:11202890-Alexandrium_andersonii.AAC.1